MQVDNPHHCLEHFNSLFVHEKVYLKVTENETLTVIQENCCQRIKNFILWFFGCKSQERRYNRVSNAVFNYYEHKIKPHFNDFSSDQMLSIKATFLQIGRRWQKQRVDISNFVDAVDQEMIRRIEEQAKKAGQFAADRKETGESLAAAKENLATAKRKLEEAQKDPEKAMSILGLEADAIEQQQECDRLKREHDTMTQEIARIQREMSVLNGRLKPLRIENDLLQVSNGHLEKNVHTQFSTVRSLEDSIQEVEQRIAQMLQEKAKDKQKDDHVINDLQRQIHQKEQALRDLSPEGEKKEEVGSQHAPKGTSDSERKDVAAAAPHHQSNALESRLGTIISDAEAAEMYDSKSKIFKVNDFALLQTKGPTDKRHQLIRITGVQQEGGKVKYFYWDGKQECTTTPDAILYPIKHVNIRQSNPTGPVREFTGGKLEKSALHTSTVIRNNFMAGFGAAFNIDKHTLTIAGKEFVILTNKVTNFNLPLVAIQESEFSEVLCLDQDPAKLKELHAHLEGLKSALEKMKASRNGALSTEDVLNEVRKYVKSKLFDLGNEKLQASQDNFRETNVYKIFKRAQDDPNVKKVPFTGQRGSQLPVIDLKDFLGRREFVSRHVSLATAWLLYQLTAAKFLDGTVHHVCHEIGKGRTHNWVVFIPKRQAGAIVERWFLDPYTDELRNYASKDGIANLNKKYGLEAIRALRGLFKETIEAMGQI